MVLGCAGLLALAGCSGISDESTDTTTSSKATAPVTTPTTSPAPTTTVPPTTVPPTTVPPTTTGPTTSPSGVTPPTGAPGFTPGQDCAAGSAPDCIDPEGDGTFVYLIGGADCMASPLSESACADLDGDGFAGYPDRG